MRDDTIVAVATPPGEGGIGIIRLSGRDAGLIGSRLFTAKLKDRRAVLGAIRDPRTGEVIDEALGLLMYAPRTYTREDTVELQAHGGTIGLRRAVELALAEGARLAEPGEFTLRAFLNGRIDLAQAESVLDVIRARTDASLRLAVEGLGGRLSTILQDLRRRLLDELAYLSARADFPDEDVPPAEIQPALEGLTRELDALIDSANYGMVYRQGARVAIVGSPNVGKSTLMNRLLREDRSIVTEIAGTTRDTVEESMNLGGVPVTLIDTAGLETTTDPIEQLGIARTQDAITRSDLLLIVLESARDLLPAEKNLLLLTHERVRVVAVNKSDLDTTAMPNLFETPVVRISALSGLGLEQLEKSLVLELTGGRVITDDSTIVTNARHRAALERARSHVAAAAEGLSRGLPEDMASSDLKIAVEAIGEITGESFTEDLLASIFRNFCIGK